MRCVVKVRSDDAGRYMCYATNALGAGQGTIEVTQTDLESGELDLDEVKAEVITGRKASGEPTDAHMKEIEEMLERERAKVESMEERFTTEIKALRNMTYNLVSNGGGGGY